MIRLVDFVRVMGYLEPEKHLDICIDNCTHKIASDEEFIEVKPTFANLAKYADCEIKDIVIRDTETINVMI